MPRIDQFDFAQEAQPEPEKEKKSQEALQEKLLKSRSVIIAGEIDQKLVEKVTTQLLLLQEMGDDPIKVYINSQGGHVESGDSIHDLLRFVRPRIIMIGTGWVASAGTTIYLAAEKEDRYSLPNTRYLIHQPMGGVRGQATDIKIEADEILKMRQRLNRLIADRTGQPVEKVELDTQRNYWMSAEEATTYGIVGKVVESYDQLK